MPPGDFFPPEYKQFPFQEGDLLVSRGRNGKFAVSKVLKIDHCEFREGSSILIQGQKFTATEVDYLLVVSSALGDYEFETFEEASLAAKSGAWTAVVGHVANRTPGAAAGMSRVSRVPVEETELEGYKLWKESFDRGEAGIF